MRVADVLELREPQERRRQVGRLRGRRRRIGRGGGRGEGVSQRLRVVERRTPLVVVVAARGRRYGSGRDKSGAPRGPKSVAIHVTRICWLMVGKGLVQIFLLYAWEHCGKFVSMRRGWRVKNRLIQNLLSDGVLVVQRLQCQKFIQWHYVTYMWK